MKQARENNARLEQEWAAKKAEIEFNVANKPLLVEQVSKAFIHNLNQIRELQRYVNILREANLNPDEHLTEEQKELLVSAEYFDRLNAATAYFPSTMVVGGDGTGEDEEGEGEGEDENEYGDEGEGVQETDMNDQDAIEEN